MSVLAATALVFSTGAAFIDGPTDPLNDAVALQPGDNPYTYLDEDGELVIDVTDDNPRLDAGGVNVDALTVEDDLFYVVHNGSEPAAVWIEHDSQAVTFVVRGDPAESGENPAIVTPADEAVPVGVRVDTRVADLTPGDRLIDEISVHARPAEPDQPADDGPGGGGPDEGGDDVADDDPPTATGDPIVTIERPGPTVREIEVRSIGGGDETGIDLDGLRVGDGVRLDALTFVREAAGEASLELRGAAEPPAGAPPVPPGVDPLGYYTVASAESDRSIAEATATLSVDRDRLARAGVGPERLAVYREAGSGWERAETTVVDAEGEAVRIRAVTDGFSAFAVAAERPALAPGAVALSADTVAPGGAVSVDLTLSNVGPAPAEGVEVRVETAGDGGVVSTEPVAVDIEPGASTTATATARLDEPGVYDLTLVGDALTEPVTAGTVTVEESGASPDIDPGGETGGGGTESGEGRPDAGRSSGDEPGAAAPEEAAGLDLTDLAGLAVLVAIVLATLHLARRAPR